MPEMLDNIRDAFINTENIIPVIGYEMLPIIDDTGQRIPYLEYLSKKIVKDRNLSIKDENGNVTINFQEIGFVLFNQVMHALLEKNRYNFSATTRELSDFAISIHSLVDTSFLEKIVKVQPFKYFFNLTFTTHLAEIVCKYRSFPNTTLKQSMFPFTFKNPKIPDDLIKNDCSYEAIIYNIAGLAYSNGNRLANFYYSDDDLLELIPEFSRRYKGQELKNYTEVVEESSLLFLGCQYPDWLTRIFISTFKPGSIKRDSAVQARIFFDYCNDNSNSFFLSKHQFTFQKNINTTNLVNDLYEYLSPPKNKYTLGIRNNDFIFISYTRDNLQLVKNIVCQLSLQNNIWFDRIKLFPGDQIDNDVKEAINNCRLFLPIITPESIAKRDTDYVRQEWIYYRDKFKDDPKVIPLVYYKDENNKVNLGQLGFQINNEFAVPGNVFYISINDAGLLPQDVTYITNHI